MRTPIEIQTRKAVAYGFRALRRKAISDAEVACIDAAIIGGSDHPLVVALSEAVWSAGGGR